MDLEVFQSFSGTILVDLRIPYFQGTKPISDIARIKFIQPFYRQGSPNCSSLCPPFGITSRDPDVFFWDDILGLSENSVPLNPMVNDYYPY